MSSYMSIISGIHVSFCALYLISCFISYIIPVSSLIFSSSCLMSYHLSCMIKSYLYSHGIRNVYAFTPSFMSLLCHWTYLMSHLECLTTYHSCFISNDVTSLFSHTVSHLIFHLSCLMSQSYHSCLMSNLVSHLFYFTPHLICQILCLIT